MLTYTLWFGTRSLISGGEYETITFDGEELGSVKYANEGENFGYRVFETQDGKIIVYFQEHRGYETNAKVFEYSSIDEAKEDYQTVLEDANVI